MSIANITLKKRLALDLFSHRREMIVSQHTLSCLIWECTRGCDVSCSHNYHNTNNENAIVPDMPVDDFLRVIDSLTPYVSPNNTMVVIAGGEPLLRHDIEECGWELYKRGYPWGIITNGHLMTPQRLDSLIESGLSAVTVSLDGLEDRHNEVRGNINSFRKVIDTLHLLAERRKNLAYDVVTCVTSGNIDELDDVKELLMWAGVENWKIRMVIPQKGNGKDNELQLSPHQFKVLLEYIKYIRQEGFMRVSYGCEGFLGDYETEVRDGFYFCRAGVNIASILTDGSISSCPGLGTRFIQGNIYKDNFVDVWENKFKLHRDREWTKTGECAECKYYNHCLGNGLHLRNDDGNLNFCHIKYIMDGE